MNSNIILATDSYKCGHKKMDAPGTEHKQYHLIPRGGYHKEIVVFGTQMLLNKLQGRIVTPATIQEAKTVIEAHLGFGAFDEDKWQHIVSEHGGVLPIEIQAIEEGTVVAPGTPIMVVSSLCAECAWLPGHIETFITRNMWYPMSVATRSRSLRKILRKWSERTSDGDQVFDFRLHDFGGRSYVGDEGAYIGGVAHLAVGWKGTDTIDAVVAARNEYNTFPAAFSVAATEHSVRTTFGDGPDSEEEYIRHVLAVNPTGIVSIVGDTYDIYKFTDLICTKFKQQIESREGKVVLRPDSGDPVKVIVWMLNRLWESFGGHINNKGFKVLSPKVGVIQGDGINEDTLEVIVAQVTDEGWSLDNLVFGCGSGLIQKGLDRDTLKFAYKGNYAVVSGHEVEMYKNPVTDPGKISHKGFMYIPNTVFENGTILSTTTLDKIRAKCAV